MEEKTQQTQPKKLFGRGIYTSKDVPIRILDKVIALMIAAAVILTVVFAINGGYYVTFDTQGGTEIAAQKLRYGARVAQPQAPQKPGYVFDSWYDEEGEQTWNFELLPVEGDVTLTAVYKPAEIVVKFDTNGGEMSGEDSCLVTYGETYGNLPVPEKEGYTFTGWEYSGQTITADTLVQMTGEHVLTAVYTKNS